MVIWDAFLLVMQPNVLLIMLGFGLFGLFVGAIPGFTASMAVALLIPVTYFFDPVPALAGIMSLSAVAIFAGDIPGALLRIPGTPASAAYVDDAYKMSNNGQSDIALGVGLLSSAIGGIFGAIILLLIAPELAKIALKFSTFEYFWLSMIGLTAAMAVSPASLSKAAISLLIGLTLSMVGLDPVSGLIRFNFEQPELVAGFSFIPVLIGFFAVSEVIRYAVDRGANPDTLKPDEHSSSDRMKETLINLKRFKWSIARGSLVGTIIGAIPGAGADIAAYISYALARYLSKYKQYFGKGYPEGIASGSAANNSSIGGALVPATVFGIPGDSLTAIIIGVLFMKGLNPGPMVFILKADLINAVFLSFLIANIAIIPLGYLAIRFFKYILQIPKAVLMPLVLSACIVGSFSVDNTTFAVTTMLFAGILGFLMEENGFPLAPSILGLVLGPMVESNFLTSLLKSNGSFIAFFERPLSMGLALVTILIWVIAVSYSIISQKKSNHKGKSNSDDSK